MDTLKDEFDRYIYIGMTKQDTACVLVADISPDVIVDRIKRKILRSESFTHYCTTWSGSDDLDRLCKLERLKIVDEIKLPFSLMFDGTEHNDRRTYSWYINVDTIYTVRDED